MSYGRFSGYTTLHQSVFGEIFSAFPLDELFVALGLFVAGLGVLAQKLEVFVRDDVSETKKKKKRAKEKNGSGNNGVGLGAMLLVGPAARLRNSRARSKRARLFTRTVRRGLKLKTPESVHPPAPTAVRQFPRAPEWRISRVSRTARLKEAPTTEKHFHFILRVFRACTKLPERPCPGRKKPRTDGQAHQRRRPPRGNLGVRATSPQDTETQGIFRDIGSESSALTKLSTGNHGALSISPPTHPAKLVPSPPVSLDAHDMYTAPSPDTRPTHP